MILLWWPSSFLLPQPATCKQYCETGHSSRSGTSGGASHVAARFLRRKFARRSPSRSCRSPWVLKQELPIPIIGHRTRTAKATHSQLPP